jgi:hypothetical protein
MEVLLVFTGLLIKHIIADYFIQANFMFKDKHLYGSRGGLSHAETHGVLTWVVLAPFIGWILALGLAFLDTFMHYHIDYVKSNYSIRNPTSPSEQKYWIVHGIDQLLHILTYVLIVYLLIEQVA